MGACWPAGWLAGWLAGASDTWLAVRKLGQPRCSNQLGACVGRCAPTPHHAPAYSLLCSPDLATPLPHYPSCSDAPVVDRLYASYRVMQV